MLCILKELHKIKLRYNSILPYKDITVKKFYLNKFHRKLPRTKSHNKEQQLLLFYLRAKQIQKYISYSNFITLSEYQVLAKIV
jgi:hypothetical protein